jgi:hypothetical protein
MHQSTVQPPQPRDVDEVINKMYEKRARLFLFAPKYDLYDALSSAERVEYEEVPDRGGLGGVNFAKLMHAIGKTVSSSTEPVSIA